MDWPGERRFAFTIVDDTDVATAENVRPVYRLLEQLGLRITKTVWAVDCPEGSRNFSESQTLEDPEYREFTVDLQDRGFEIAFHGATMESSLRDRTERALERFREVFGSYPRVHANHAFNRENLYWGAGRLDDPVLRFVYGRMDRRHADYYGGHRQDSPYWWGDLCREHVRYVRNLTFDELNLARVNPSMPYHDPSRPWVEAWFSAADAEDWREMVRLLSPDRLDRLEQEGGFSVVATHLGKGFAQDGEVRPEVRERLEDLADRPGWFPTTDELLDWLRARRESLELPRAEWRRMQWTWAKDLYLRRRRWDAAGAAG